ncbi:MAG: hypothetical protein F6K44_16080, partial [Moorea sp. SIO3E2]|nr:hypothetical protein [Moorena sp. SIO3E2]
WHPARPKTSPNRQDAYSTGRVGILPAPKHRRTGKMPIPPVEWASCPPQNIAEQARCLFYRIFFLFPVP